MNLLRSTDPRDHAIPYQWHASEPWIDAATGKLTSYIAGFPNEAEAIAYGKRHGWTPEPTITEETNHEQNTH